jgi:hypothetical protein
MPVQRERQQVTNKVLAYLNSLPQCKAIKTYSDGHIEKGTADVIGCYKGRMLHIECKVPGNRPTQLQWHRIAEWSIAGAYSCYVDSLDQVKHFIEMLDRER